MSATTLPTGLMVAGFDGNRRPFPTMLTSKARRAGVTEVTLAGGGLDNIRAFLAPGKKVTDVVPYRAQSWVETIHQGLGVDFTYEGIRYSVLMLNSGYGTNIDVTRRSMKSMADALHARKADVKVFIGIEFSTPGDKIDESSIMAAALGTGFRHFFTEQQDTIFISRKSGKKDEDINPVPHTSVPRWSPKRYFNRLTLLRYGVEFDAFHSAAGTGRQAKSRPEQVRQPLLDSWNRLRSVGMRDIEKTLTPTQEPRK